MQSAWRTIHVGTRRRVVARGCASRARRCAVRRTHAAHGHARAGPTCARRLWGMGAITGTQTDEKHERRLGTSTLGPGERRLGTWTLDPVPRSEKLHRRSKSGGARVSGGGVGRRRLSHGRCLESWCVAWCVVRAACAVRDAAAAHPARITIALHTHVACHIAHTMLLCMRKCLCHTSCIVHTALCQV